MRRKVDTRKNKRRERLRTRDGRHREARRLGKKVTRKGIYL